MNKNMLKLGLILTLFAGVACVSLAVVHSYTKETINKQKQKDLEAALKEIFPAADGFDDVTKDLKSGDPRVSIKAAYAVKKGGALLGVAVQASGPSYGGDATLLSGFSTDKKVERVIVLDIVDTPGLGANAKKSTYYVDKAKKVTFPGQFSGKSLSDAFEVKKDVQAITASTITSAALTRIVKASGAAAADYLDKGGAK